LGVGLGLMGKGGAVVFSRNLRPWMVARLWMLFFFFFFFFFVLLVQVFKMERKG
jgi:hypothetical protein